MATIADVLKNAAMSIDSDSPRLDAELLLAEVVGCDRSYFFTWPEKELSSEQLSQFSALLERRGNGEPVAYILGRQGFWDLQLSVNSSTLIPRPDTEVLVETVLSLLPSHAVNILDVGTGTGAIALALKKERQDCHVYAADFQSQAVQLALNNARANNLDVAIFCGDWLSAIKPGSIDFLVSNPPYIDASDEHLLRGDVRFEPTTALIAADFGLADIKTIARQSSNALVSGGYLLVEHGYDQQQAVTDIFLAQGFINVRSIKDYGGNWRVTLGQKE